MAWTRRYDEAEPQRVNRWLAQSGVCSRREAEGLILQGLVSIDGETVTDAGRKIQPGQTLTLADAGKAQLDNVPGRPRPDACRRTSRWPRPTGNCSRRASR
jgi:23S rRNA pseudouridine2604 synthase